MKAQGVVLRTSMARRACALFATIAGLLAVGLGPSIAPAGAAPPAKTDVMIIFDTSGSMGPELEEAKVGINEVIANIKGSLPDVEFGVSEVRDYLDFGFETPTEAEEELSSEKPWKLDQKLTPEASLVKNAIEPLEAEGGGDEPEAYGRALWETDTNPEVGWRTGARHIIIMVADNVPHDFNLDEGLPESDWALEGRPAPWNTGEELPGKHGIKGTIWKTGSETEFHADLNRLASDEKPLEMVDFQGDETGYVPYWEYWAHLTGGVATSASNEHEELSSKLTTLTEAGALGIALACPSGKARGADGVCFTPSPSTTSTTSTTTTPSKHPTATQVICSLVTATATDTCTATVGDGASSGASHPGGTVSFASSSGGAFTLGSSCSLVPTPSSGNVSSCSVQFAPPIGPSTLPAITATYAGDGTHNSSSASTHYGPLAELASHLDFASIGTIGAGGTVDIPVDCGFPCEALGELLSIPGVGGTASVASVNVNSNQPATAAKRHKKAKPVLLGKGSLKMSKPGKGKLIIKPSAKGRHALGKVKAKGLHVTLKFAVRTVNGTVVVSKSQRITLRPLKKKGKSKH